MMRPSRLRATAAALKKIVEGIRPMAKLEAGRFVREVRQETSKVTWPTRKETTITTIMVFVFVTILSLFFLGVDQILSWGIQLILGVGA